MKTSESMTIQSSLGSGVCHGISITPEISLTSQKRTALTTTMASPRDRRIQRPEIASRSGRTNALTSATTIPIWRRSPGMTSSGMLVRVPSGAVVGSCTRDRRSSVVIIASVLTRIRTMNPRMPPPGRVASRTSVPRSHTTKNATPTIA